jgi:hypothetical protein
VPDQYGLCTDVNAPAGVVQSDPFADQRPDGQTDAPQPIVSSALLRRGFLAVYPGNKFSGESIMLTPGKVFNVRDCVWADKTVRSWYASSSEFDPAVPQTQA